MGVGAGVAAGVDVGMGVVVGNACGVLVAALDNNEVVVCDVSGEVATGVWWPLLSGFPGSPLINIEVKKNWRSEKFRTEKKSRQINIIQLEDS